MDEDGHIIDEEILKNIDKINESFLKHNHEIMEREK